MFHDFAYLLVFGMLLYQPSIYMLVDPTANSKEKRGVHESKQNG